MEARQACAQGPPKAPPCVSSRWTVVALASSPSPCFSTTPSLSRATSALVWPGAWASTLPTTALPSASSQVGPAKWRPTVASVLHEGGERFAKPPGARRRTPRPCIRRSGRLPRAASEARSCRRRRPRPAPRRRTPRPPPASAASARRPPSLEAAARRTRAEQVGSISSVDHGPPCNWTGQLDRALTPRRGATAGPDHYLRSVTLSSNQGGRRPMPPKSWTSRRRTRADGGGAWATILAEAPYPRAAPSLHSDSSRLRIPWRRSRKSGKVSCRMSMVRLLFALVLRIEPEPSKILSENLISRPVQGARKFASERNNL